MSTSATYEFTNSKNELTPKTTVYIHMDGYLEGAAFYFWNMLQREGSIASFAVNFIRANDRAELVKSHAAIYGTEYQYSLDGEQLTARKVAGGIVFDGLVYDFVNKYLMSTRATYEFTNSKNDFTPIEKRLAAKAGELESYKARFPHYVGNISGLQAELDSLKAALKAWLSQAGLSDVAEVTIAKSESENIFHDLEADFRAGSDVWREVSEDDYEYALGAVPPIDRANGCFLLGEAWSGNSYHGFACIGERYFAKTCNRSKFAAEVDRLDKFLAGF